MPEGLADAVDCLDGGWRHRMKAGWASGAVGSAREWHSRGHGFDSRLVHHFSLVFPGTNAVGRTP